MGTSNESERYNLYLASREWAVKKQAVHERAGGLCERCRRHPIAAVHHLTYIRKYNEDLMDLQAICRGCHDFVHAKSNTDPAADNLQEKIITFRIGFNVLVKPGWQCPTLYGDPRGHNKVDLDAVISYLERVADTMRREILSGLSVENCSIVEEINIESSDI